MSVGNQQPLLFYSVLFFVFNLWHFPGYTSPVYPVLQGLGFDILCHYYPTVPACLHFFPLMYLTVMPNDTFYFLFQNILYLFFFSYHVRIFGISTEVTTDTDFLILYSIKIQYLTITSP